MTARPDHFDSLGVEPGPTPILLPEGILLIYNGWDPCPRPQNRLGAVLQGRSRKDRQALRSAFHRAAIQIRNRWPARFHVHRRRGTYFKGLWRFYYGAADKTIGLAEIEDISTLFKDVP